MRIALLTLVVGAVMFWVAPAAAYLIAKPACHSLKCRLAAQTENLRHARYVCYNGAGHHRKWSCLATGWLRRELAKTRAALNPYRVPGWFRSQALCIYSHENGGYGWHANTGNGYQTGLQFAPSTWIRAGGQIDANGNYYYASQAETIYRAWVICRSHGGSWTEWSTRGYCGL